VSRKQAHALVFFGGIGGSGRLHGVVVFIGDADGDGVAGRGAAKQAHALVVFAGRIGGDGRRRGILVIGDADGDGVAGGSDMTALSAMRELGATTSWANRMPKLIRMKAIQMVILMILSLLA
jgi:hypothetical protein